MGALKRLAAVLAVLVLALALPARAQQVPELTQPVNDFAGVIDQASAASMDRAIRALQQATGDVVVVATVETVGPYGDIREYAVKLFENHGRGIGEKDKHNGVLVLLAVKDRQVRIEVGYGLEEFVTDGFAAETSREFMAPEFKRGNYGAGLQAGVMRLVGRIADRRNVTLSGVPKPEPVRRQRSGRVPIGLIILGIILVIIVVIIFVVALLAAAHRGGPRFPRSGHRDGVGGSGWSGWNSGVGSFGGGGGGGFGGGFGGGGGGFGGFGGGGSGGGGGGASW